MPFITEEQVLDQLRVSVAYAVMLRRKASVDAGTYLLGFLDIANQIGGRGEFGTNRLGSAARTRRQLAVSLSEARSWLAANYLQWATHPDVGRPISGDNATQLAIDELQRYMVRVGYRIPSRQFSFGTPTAVGPTSGDGIWRRLNVDKDGLVFEAQFADVKQAECVRDQNLGGVRGAEVFEVRGTQGALDILEDRGVGGSVTMAPPRIEEIAQIITNPHFSAGASAAAPSGWSVSGAVVRDTDLAYTFRNFPNDPTPASVVVPAGASLSQLVIGTGSRLATSKPWYVCLRCNNGKGGFNGIVRMTLGTQSVDLDFSALGTVNTWRALELGLGTNAWYENFMTDNLTLTIQCVGGTGGTSVNVDDLIFCAWRPFSGGYYMPRPGNTPWLRGDLFQWQDTENLATGLIQRETWRFLRRHLPSVDATGSGILSGGSIVLSGVSGGALTLIADPLLTHATLAAQVGADVPI